MSRGLFRATLTIATSFLCCVAEARQWTTSTRQTFQAEFVPASGETAICRVPSGRPLNPLSAADRLLIGKTVHAQGSGDAATPPVSATAAPTGTAAAIPCAARPPAPPRTKASGALQFAAQPIDDGDSVVDTELTGAGLKNVRFDKFDGGHHLHRPDLPQALDWFVTEYKKTAGGASVL